MQRLRLSDVKASVAKVVKLNSTDTTGIAEYVNLAQERLLYAGGKTVGTYGRYRVCVNANCITLPRELENIERAAICERPARIRSEWFEFLDAGPGILRDDDNIGDQVIDRGEACSFDDPIGSNKKLAVWTDKSESTGTFVNLQFYDNNGQWVRTSYNDEWIDGQNIVLAAKGTFYVSTSEVAPLGLVRVVKPVTNGVVRLYEYDTVNAVYRPLGVYAPDETIPVYRRYLIPSLTAQAGDDCDSVAVDITGKLRFIPVLKDADFLVVNHRGAVILMAQAIKKEQDDLPDAALIYAAKAEKVLDDQLKHYKGDGEIQPITFTNSDVTGPAVQNLI